MPVKPNNIVYLTDPAISTRVCDLSVAMVKHTTPEAPPEVPVFDKHRDGPYPTTKLQRGYIRTQTVRYDKNLVRLYRGYEAKMARRLQELEGDFVKAEAEAGLKASSQAYILHSTHVWRKDWRNLDVGQKKDAYLEEIYRYWRDICHAPAYRVPEYKKYDKLWEFVAGRPLPVELLTVPDVFNPDLIYGWLVDKPVSERGKRLCFGNENQKGDRG